MNPELFDALTFSLLVTADVYLSFLVARTTFRRDHLPIQMLASLLVFWSSVVVTGLALGTIGLIRNTTFIPSVTCVLVIFGCIASIVSRSNAGNSEDLSNSPSEHTLHLSAGGKIVFAKPEYSTWRRFFRPQFVFVSFLFAYVFTYGIVQLPFDWDSIAYHLPLIDHWIQSGSLWNQNCAFWYVPGNNELLGLYFGIGFSGDFWVQLHNVVPGLVLFSGLIAYSRELRLAKANFVILIVAVFAVQPVLRQLISAENDLAVVALFVSGSLFGWRWVNTCSRENLLFLSLSIGLLSGVKYYALGYVAVLAFLCTAWLLVQRRWKTAAQTCVATIITVTLLGGFWYYRNWLLEGTPLFPKGISGMPDLWSEIRPHFSSSRLVGCNRFEVVPLLSRAWLVQSGIIPMVSLALAWLPLCIAIGGHLRWRRVRDSGGRGALLLWLSCFSTAAFIAYLFTPNVVETEFETMNMLKLQYHPVRFGLCVFVLSTLALMATLFNPNDSTKKQRLAIQAVLVVFVVTQVIWQSFAVFNWHAIPDWLGVSFWWAAGKRRLLWTWTILFIVALAAWSCVSAIAKRSILAANIFCVVVSIALFCHVSPLLARRWHNRFVGHFGRVLRSDCVAAWERLKRPTDRLGVFDYRYYPFLGSHRENAVFRPLWHSDASELQDFVEEERLSMLVFATNPEVAHIRYRDSRLWFHQKFVGEMVFYRDSRLVLVRRPVNSSDQK